MRIDGNSTMGEIAQAIITTNLADYHVCDLARGLEIILSPIWEPVGGKAVRRACLAPRSMRAHYFEGPARHLLESEEGMYVVAAGLEYAGDQLVQMIAELRDLYCADDAPYFPLDVPGDPNLAVVSVVLADAARKARVGMSAAEIVASYENPGASSPKLLELSQVEAAFMEEVSHAPVDELVAALAKQPRLRRSNPQ